MTELLMQPAEAPWSIIGKISTNQSRLTHTLPEPKEPMKTARNGENGYYRNDELGGPIHSERQMDIIVIGAGASGLCIAYKLQRSFSNFSLTMYEKNPEISGTWYENRYPGCACDVPAHNYVFSWEPKKDWSAVYVGNTEIKSYFQSFAAKYNLDKHIKLNHQVIEAKWEERQAKWMIRIKDDTTGVIIQRSCDILINASGILNNWKWPDIPGLHTFTGTLLHSAHYDNGVDLTGKRVGLIGNGYVDFEFCLANYCTHGVTALLVFRFFQQFIRR
jgi:cation diffusion facilitator CzcD-associated flavoprotein CzcO